MLAGFIPSITTAQIHFLIPGGAGGGWDRTARAVGETLVETGLIRSATYENMSGGGGAKGIAYTIEKEDPEMLLVNSTPIVVRSLQNFLPQTYKDLTPIASVIGDYSVIVVRASSEFTALAEFLEAWRVAPRQYPVAGGSVVGGTDHIFAALLARSQQINPNAIKYIPYDAGGKAMAGLLSGEVAFLSSGYGEVVDLEQQGWVRVLCIAAPEAIPSAPHLPTCDAAGAPGIEFVNWRGFFAAPTISDARIQTLSKMLEQMTMTEEWDQTRSRFGWVSLFRAGPDFERLLSEQATELSSLLTQLGLILEKND
ncbi:MAG: tripartite tricarboxylate transporter substrate binding protein [Pseudomonadota bacterium]